MPDQEKPAGAPGSDGAAGAQTREQVREKVLEELRAKCTRADGTIDIEAMEEAFFQRDEKLHFTRQEAKERRLREEKHGEELAAREAKIKAAEEAKLLEEKRYQELLSKRDEELAAANARLKELARLEAIVKTVNERNQEEVKREYNTLGAPDRALFDDFAAALPAESFDQQLAFVRKLRERSGTPGTPPAGSPPPAQGGRQTGAPAAQMSPEDLAELKKQNPDLYWAKLRELQAVPTWAGMTA